MVAGPTATAPVVTLPLRLAALALLSLMLGVGASRPWRILVVANETVAGRALRDEIRRRAEAHERVDVLVVAPALNSRLRRWLSDEDRARARAEELLDESLTALARVGIDAQGLVGDADPVQAIADALTGFDPDELVISTHPAGRSNWLERNVVSRAFDRFRLPITHVIVDLEAERRAAGREAGR